MCHKRVHLTENIWCSRLDGSYDVDRYPDISNRLVLQFIFILIKFIIVCDPSLSLGWQTALLSHIHCVLLGSSSGKSSLNCTGSLARCQSCCPASKCRLASESFQTSSTIVYVHTCSDPFSTIIKTLHLNLRTSNLYPAVQQESARHTQ